MALYQDLKKEGWSCATYPRNKIDKLAKKYKIIRYFHRPIISVDRRFLCKNDLCVFFDISNVDILRNGKTLLSFGKKANSDDILTELKKIEKQKYRELKLNRLLKNVR